MTLDADLQDDPHEIPNFLAATPRRARRRQRLEEGPARPVAQGRARAACSTGWSAWVTGVHLHDHNCGMKATGPRCCAKCNLYGELHRFVPVLAAARGFKVGELVINHRPRKFGRSKYGWQRFVKGFLDLLTVQFLTGFGHRPQHLLGSYGLLAGSAGSLGCCSRCAGDRLVRVDRRPSAAGR